MTLKNIGIVHGGFDHSRLLNSVKSIKNDIETRNKETLDVLARLRYGFNSIPTLEDWDVLDFLP